MALSQLGTTQKYTTTGNSTTEKTGTITVPSGNRRHMLLLASRGYCKAANSIFPASVTVGGQTVDAGTVEGESWATGNTGSRTYVANEATIAAMSGGAFTIAYDSALDSAYEIVVTVIFLQDTDQTAGVVDSGVDPGDSHGGSGSVTLTTAAGDWCIAFGDQRADQTANSLGSGMTALGTTAASSTALEKSNQRYDTIVATGSSTTVLMTMGNTEQGALHALAFREDLGSSGPLEGQVVTTYVNDIA